jgi:putative glutamine amidotransferase
MIGITMDVFLKKEGQSQDFYIAKPLYHQSILKYGGRSMPLTLCHESIGYYCDILKGLVLTGGDYDLCPSLYGQDPHEKTKPLKERQNFEWALLEEFLKTKKPILGVCAGFQMLNVYFGGTLIQHLDDWNCVVDHKGSDPFQVAHSVQVIGFKPFQSFDQVPVNTSHHQGIDQLGHGLEVAAICPDDQLIEAFYHTEHPFCLGVQWHPEFHTSPLDQVIWVEFLKASYEN